MLPDRPVYDPKTICPKCGNANHSVTYCAETRQNECFEKVLVDEYLLVTCSCCRFTWKTLPLTLSDDLWRAIDESV